MLVRRSEIEANPDLVSQLNQKFKILYDYFEWKLGEFKDFVCGRNFKTMIFWYGKNGIAWL